MSNPRYLFYFKIGDKAQLRPLGVGKCSGSFHNKVAHLCIYHNDRRADFDVV